jgi:hypothetical protein
MLGKAAHRLALAFKDAETGLFRHGNPCASHPICGRQDSSEEKTSHRGKRGAPLQQRERDSRQRHEVFAKLLRQTSSTSPFDACFVAQSWLFSSASCLSSFPIPTSSPGNTRPGLSRTAPVLLWLVLSLTASRTTLAAEYAYVLRPTGRLYIITDVPDLFEWMTEHLKACPLFREGTLEEKEKDDVLRLVQTSTEESRKAEREGRLAQSTIFVRV